jgi:hypothetical protein
VNAGLEELRRRTLAAELQPLGVRVVRGWGRGVAVLGRVVGGFWFADED